VAFSSAGLPAFLPSGAAPASVPPALLGSTVKAALSMAGQGPASSLVMAKVLSIMEGVIKTMWLAHVKFWGVVLLSLIGLVAVGVGVQSRPPEAQPDSPQPVVALDVLTEPAKKKTEVFEGKMDSVRGAWFQEKHRQQGMTVVVDDKAKHVLYFGPEKREERIREALKMEGAMVIVKGRLLSPEEAVKIHDVASGKDRRILEVDDIRFGENIDPDRAVQVPVVLRVKWLAPGSAKAIAMEEVEVLGVLKNTSGQVFDKKLFVGRANVAERADLPRQVCTIYLQPYEDAKKNRFWTLLHLNLNQKGVSHVAEGIK